MNAKFRTPAVTVVMPVYNAAATLDAAIASVMAQTFADFELLLHWRSAHPADQRAQYGRVAHPQPGRRCRRRHAAGIH
jgi:GT2 family glycosyltransferase